MLRINFSSNIRTKKFILKAFGKKVDKDGYIIESKTSERVLDSGKQPITIREFGGIKNGSEIFVKNDIVSVAGFYKKYLSAKNVT